MEQRTGTIDKIEKQEGDPTKGGAFWTIQIGDARYMYFEEPPVKVGDKVSFKVGKTRNQNDYIWKGSIQKLTPNGADPSTTATGINNDQAKAEAKSEEKSETKSNSGASDSPYRTPAEIQAATAVALAKDLTLAWSSNASAGGRDLTPVMFGDTLYMMMQYVVKAINDAAKELGK